MVERAGLTRGSHGAGHRPRRRVTVYHAPRALYGLRTGERPEGVLTLADAEL